MWKRVCSLGLEGGPRLRHRDQRPAGRRRDCVRATGAVTLCPSLMCSEHAVPPHPDIVAPVMNWTVSLKLEKRGAWWWFAFTRVAQPQSVKETSVASSFGGLIPSQTQGVNTCVMSRGSKAPRRSCISAWCTERNWPENVMPCTQKNARKLQSGRGYLHLKMELTTRTVLQ